MNQDVVIRRLEPKDCTPELLRGFDRHQDVKRCWRKQDGAWRLVDIAFVERWGDDEKRAVTQGLATCLREGGVAFGAFAGARAVGFASVAPALFGAKGEYVNMPMLHVSAESRSRGIGRALFAQVCRAARALGAQKLYISAHSSEASQAFYRSVGCVEAKEIDPALFAAEPVDCHMEYPLQTP